MKKKLGMILLVLAAVFTCGCTKVVDLTDEENYLIAEYAAELLIKYSAELDLKYDPESEAEVPLTESTEATEEPSSTEFSEATTTEELTTETAEKTTEEKKTEEKSTEEKSTEEKTTEEKTTEKKKSDVRTEEATGTEEETEGVPANQRSDYDLADMLGTDKASVKYQYYAVCDTYPSYDKEGMQIEINATSGHKLLVLKFAIENKTNEDQNLSFFDSGVEYHIIINNNKTAKNMLTILIDDLFTYEGFLGASDRTEAVLLFSVSESIANNLQDLKLRCTGSDGSEVVLQLEQ